MARQSGYRIRRRRSLHQMGHVAVRESYAFGREFYIQSIGADRLEDAVEKLREAVDVPALAMGTIEGDRIEIAVAGVRGMDSWVRVETHMGTNTRCLFACLLPSFAAARIRRSRPSKNLDRLR